MCQAAPFFRGLPPALLPRGELRATIVGQAGSNCPNRPCAMAPAGMPIARGTLRYTRPNEDSPRSGAPRMNNYLAAIDDAEQAVIERKRNRHSYATTLATRF